MENFGSMTDSRSTGFCEIMDCDVLEVQFFSYLLRVQGESLLSLAG